MTDRRLTPEELESLLGSVPDSTGEPPVNSAAPQVRAIAGLRRLHGALSSRLSVGLSEAVRSKVDVRLVDVATISYRQWRQSGAAPACIGAFRAPGGQVAWMLRLDGDILRAVLDGLLGGLGQVDASSGAPLTDWELRLSERAVEPIRKLWLDAWHGWFPLQVTSFQPLVASTEPPEWPATSRLFVARYQISSGQIRGPLELVTPVDLAVRWMSFQWSRTDAAERQTGTEGSTTAPVTTETDPGEIRVTLADTVISRDDLESLQPGDVLATDHRIDRPLDAHLPDGTHLPVQLGVVDGKKAVRP